MAKYISRNINIVDESGNNILEIDSNGRITVNANLQAGSELIGKVILDTGDNVIGRVKLTNGTNLVSIDEDSLSLYMIDSVHALIHEGKHFYIKSVVDLANGASYNILLVTPSEGEIHFFYQITHELEGSFIIKEGVSVDVNGTPMTSVNNNRNSSTVATLLMFHTPTNPTGGTQIDDGQQGNNQKFGGDTRSDVEKVLKKNTKYLITLTNKTANNNLFDFKFLWYEVD